MLPPLLVLTDRHQASVPLVEIVAAVVAAGAWAVVLRENDLPQADRAALAATLAPLIHDAGGLLLSAGQALPGCDGAHLGARKREPGAVPGDRADGLVVGRSCHDADELLAAEAGGADYVTHSPVFPTHSKPGYGPPLGTARLAELAAWATVPVYALGGIETPEKARACCQAGVAGVAVMGAVMRSEAPGRVVSDLLRAASEVARS